MLRDELLRSKNDEISRCLQSRKRKLSELYFATVGCLGATDRATADTLYEQKKQAFLDANDLAKGRFFNESTLPSFPDYADIVAQLQVHARPTSSEATALERSTKEQIHQTKPLSPGQPCAGGRIRNVPETATDDKIQLDQDALSSRTDIKHPTVETASPQPSTAQRTDVAAQPTPTVSTKPQFTEPGTPVSTHEHAVPGSFTSPSHTRPSLRDKATEPSVLEHGVSTISQRTDTNLQYKQDRRPSLPLGTATRLDQPLSPASSIEPFSNNTPIPPAASSDTSPESGEPEDHDAISAKPVVDTQDHISAQVQGKPTPVIPSTPDEQLRLEEAQSLLQNTQTLPTSRAPGDLGKPEISSLSKQLVKEGAQPKPLSSEDQKVSGGRTFESFQDAAISPASSGIPEAHANRGIPVSAPTEPLVEQPTLETASMNKRPSPANNVAVQPVPERMTTRVSSGAIRHKSVSEILGETPKTAQQTNVSREPAAMKSPVSQGSPDSASRIRQRKDREKERTKLSTVVFLKKQLDKNDAFGLVRQKSGDLVAGLNEQQDYLFTLFQNKAYSPPRSSNISTLLATAHKTLSTSNHLLEYQEQMDCRTLRRIYALQNANRWPLRQLERSAEPHRQGTHWDVLLDHMKWMRTDFKEERKWKIAAAKSCAEWCAEYVQSEPAQRSQLRVHTKTRQKRWVEDSKMDGVTSDSMVVENAVDDMGPVSQPTPDLVPSAEEESVSEGFADEPRSDLRDTVAPAAIFSLGSEEFNFSIDFTPVSEKLLGELPIYAPIGLSPETHMPVFKYQPDTDWKTEVLQVSKYSSGRISFRDDEPARKKSRYDYTLHDDQYETPIIDINPEQTDVALFRPENKHIRDRIHPGHSFRPPTEYPMPSVGFFESRQSSQWTLSEDDELRRLVKDYSYNWSLISSCLSSPSMFSSGAERRTPWECFERWIGLEGLPADMSKTQYFRAYHQRLEAAQRTVLAQQQAAQQQQQQAQQGNPGSVQPVIRRRTTQPVRVDRRRASRHLALLDAMRKLAKKRETMLQKQQQATHLASLRKVNEANQPKPPITNPADFSKLKYEREQKLQERQEQYRQQMIAQQRATLAAQRALPNQQAAALGGVVGRTPNGVQPAGAQPLPASAQNAVANGMPPNANLNHGNVMPMQGLSNGRPMGSPLPPNAMGVKMVPQQGMQQQMAGRPGIPIQGSPDNARVIREANRLQEQQRLLQSRQQQQGQQVQQAGQQQFHSPQQFGQQGAHSPNVNVQGLNGNQGNATSAAILAAMQAATGITNPSFHNSNVQGVTSASPRMAQPNHLSSGVVPTITNIQNQIQRSHPNLSPEQVAKLATDRLHLYQQQQQRMTQAAMNAAVGSAGGAIQSNFQIPQDSNFQSSPQASGNVGIQNSQQTQFSPMMRVAQPNQQNRVPVGSSPSLNGSVLPQQSRSATPQAQRSGSVQQTAAASVPGTNKSPHPPAAQMASNSWINGFYSYQRFYPILIHEVLWPAGGVVGSAPLKASGRNVIE
ncbi:Chromatin modification-related protein eaf1 [Talaromyces atroroseus]|uniref:Vacuolar import and degradation protein 21 n=1 Tax=Talaromyces atroroseus TaxID=1441469 RepID=A0A225BCV5_TALAT|nr:Chromatin modification-related protein eaf1 [Talaromyces atroroseus]OKL63877.1 Chromatin modification-related protein eaf1 [Talaromyces atroroseus]